MQSFLSGGGPYYYNDAQTLTVAASNATTYQWYQGLPPNTTTPVGSNASQLNTSALTQTASFWVRVTNSCGRVDSNGVTVNVQLRAPSGLVATRTLGTNTITLTWQASNPTPSGTLYNILRRSGGSFVAIGNSTALSFPDTVSAGFAYFYQVTASASGLVTSAPSNNDEANTLSFQTVTSGGVVAFSQFDELLSGVNAIRHAWNASLPTWQWSDVLNQTTNSPCGYGTVGQVPQVGAIVYAALVMRLRCAIDNALALCTVTRGWSYTDPDVTGLMIKAVHLTDLQHRTGNVQ